MKRLSLFFLFAHTFCSTSYCQQQKIKPAGIFLSEISWTTAKQYLTPQAVIVIPLGAGAKEHGPHLPLAADQYQAEYYAQQIARQSSVVIAPIINYSYYPPFLQYAGSTSINFETGRNMLLDIVRSLAGYGARRFYVVNEGITTISILQSAQKILKDEGILLYYSDYGRAAYEELSDGIQEEKFGGHASELETSNLLIIKKELVDMSKAENDTAPMQRRGFSLTPVADSNGTLSPSGIVGYAKLATEEKGKKLLDGLIPLFINEIDSIRNAELPLPVDQTVLLNSFSGIFQTTDGKQLKLLYNKNHLEYTFNNKVYGRFYPLYYNGNNELSGQHVNIKFIPSPGNKMLQALISFTGETYLMSKIAEH